MSVSSALSPEFDKARIASLKLIMPRSPWLASAGWTKRAGVPVEASVAAIFRAIWPLLPIPVTISRPRTAAQISSASPKEPSSVCANCSSPSISARITRRPTVMSCGSGGASPSRPNPVNASCAEMAITLFPKAPSP